MAFYTFKHHLIPNVYIRSGYHHCWTNLTEKSRETVQDLFEEVHNCVICGKPIRGKNENEIWVTYHPDEKRNLFVEPGCMNLLKKFEIAYGKEFFDW